MRKTRAFVVVGRSLKVSGHPAPEFLKTSLRPSEMTSLKAEGGFPDLGVGFERDIDGDDQRSVGSVSGLRKLAATVS